MLRFASALREDLPDLFHVKMRKTALDVVGRFPRELKICEPESGRVADVLLHSQARRRYQSYGNKSGKDLSGVMNKINWCCIGVVVLIY